MSFNSDRFAKLAGLPAPVSAPAKAALAPAAAPRVIREAAAPKARESAEITQLRSIIRNEARTMIAEMRKASGSKKGLSEALTLGFAGPGFGGDKRVAFAAPLTSARSIASLFEMAEDNETGRAENDEPNDEPNEDDEMGY